MESVSSQHVPQVPESGSVLLLVMPALSTLWSRIAAGRLLLVAGMGAVLAWLGHASAAHGSAGWQAALLGAGLTASLMWGRSRISPTGHPARGLPGGEPDRTPQPDELGMDRSAATEPAALRELVAQVVAMWIKQADLSRATNQQGIEALLESFSELAGELTSLHEGLSKARLRVEPGAIGDAIETQSEAMGALMAPMREAMAEREAMFGHVQRCATCIHSIQDWTRNLRDLAQQVRLVAFNASIEATHRHGRADSGDGVQAVVVELQRIAEALRRSCEWLDELVRPLSLESMLVTQAGQLHRSSEDSLLLEMELQARRALQALLGEVAGGLSGAGDMQAKSDVLNRLVEELFTRFQFGDRVEQMLQIVGKDMQKLVDWSKLSRQPTRQDIKQWLVELEAAYTMDEQRSQHHDTTMVDHSGRVDFF